MCKTQIAKHINTLENIPNTLPLVLNLVCRKVIISFPLINSITLDSARIFFLNSTSLMQSSISSTKDSARLNPHLRHKIPIKSIISILRRYHRRGPPKLSITARRNQSNANLRLLEEKASLTTGIPRGSFQLN